MAHTTHPSRETLEAALMLACKRIADSQQTYEEADSAEGWYDRYVREAEEQQEPADAARM